MCARHRDPVNRPLDSTRVPRYAEVATFMRLPRTDELDTVDIGLLGVPFQLGTSVRMGSWAGPSAVREGSRVVRGHNSSTGVTPHELASIADIGDAPHNPLDLEESLELIGAHFTMLRERGVRTVACGGDHTMTLPILRGLFDGTPFGVVHFDAHTDCWDELYGKRINSGTIMRRAVEEGIIDPQRMVQIGVRGSRFGPGDVESTEELGITCITYDRYEDLGRDAVIAEVRRIVGDGPTYLTFDMDALDPAYAPGTAGPEPGGLTMRDAQVLIRALMDCNVVGADVSEIAPMFDPTGMTVLNAAQIMFELLCVVATAMGRESAAAPGGAAGAVR